MTTDEPLKMATDAESRAVADVVAPLLQGLITTVMDRLQLHPLTIAANILESLAADLKALSPDLAAAYLQTLRRRILAKDAASEKQAEDASFHAFGALLDRYTEAATEQSAPPPVQKISPAPVMTDRPGGKTLDVTDWCAGLTTQAVERLAQAGSPAAFCLTAYYDDGVPKVQCMATQHADVDAGSVKHLIGCAARACEAYAEVGNPNMPAPTERMN